MRQVGKLCEIGRDHHTGKCVISDMRQVGGCTEWCQCTPTEALMNGLEFKDILVLNPQTEFARSLKSHLILTEYSQKKIVFVTNLINEKKHLDQRSVVTI
jgi:hypothetical protein